jgi:tRNA modification GTPase
LVPRHATLARVCDSGGVVVDEVIATFFAAPHSYTTEDIVEIAAHGSPALLREIVRAALRAGARLAEPGEFTLRAFLHGRLDLVQAEAVADLVEAVTPLQARVAFDQLEGTLTRAIGELDGQLFDLAARLEASLDFPDEGYHFVGPGEVSVALRGVCAGVERLLESARRGRVIRDGRQIAILGKPNVGKSSLFNWLVGSDRAIVAEMPGTTRDLVTESVDFEGIRLGLVDTAGIREGVDEVEREGVVRARGAAAVADVILLVCDLSRPFDEADERLVAETAGTRRVIVCNKADLVGEQARWAWGAGLRGVEARGDSMALSRDPGSSGNGLRSALPALPGSVVVSLKTGVGLDELRAVMRVMLECESNTPRDTAMVTNLRHESLLHVAHESLMRSVAGLEDAGDELSEELVLADMAEARRAFEEVTGGRTTEDVLAHIFSRFCVGK